jgi:hypothetical protein
MFRRTLVALLALFAFSYARAADPTVKVEDKAPPKELSDAVRGLLASKAMHVSDDKGKLLFTVWARKELDAKADADVKAGAKYTNIDESTILGAVQFAADWSDYRKQKIKAGVYTLRLGIQPMDGDHMGTAPYGEFGLLVPAAEDTKPDLMDAESLHEISKKSTTRKHPGLMLLFPNRKPTDAPAIEAKPKEHWTLNYQVTVKAGSEKATLGFSLVVVGQTMAE